jgi:nucleoside-diphosphate-sugar epimerase
MTGVLDEATPVRPAPGSDYGDSKTQAERVVARAASQGLSTVVLRPARVFGPFARTFIMRPIQAIAQKRFRWIGSPDVPCDMVYVDNVVEAILRSLVAPHDKAGGESFGVGDGLDTTWREFYQYFASGLDLGLDSVPIGSPQRAARKAWLQSLLLAPVNYVRGLRAVLGSSEFKALGRRILQTDGVGTLPRWALEHVPGLERAARRLVKADGSLPVYRRQEPAAVDVVEMGSGGARVSIEKARRLLGYQPVVARDQALELTLNWIQNARLV